MNNEIDTTEVIPADSVRLIDLIDEDLTTLLHEFTVAHDTRVIPVSVRLPNGSAFEMRHRQFFSIRAGTRLSVHVKLDQFGFFVEATNSGVCQMNVQLFRSELEKILVYRPDY